MPKLTRILHLSDLHFGTKADAKNWHGQLTDDLRHELKCDKLDAIIVSGDVANFSEEDEYKAALFFFEEVCHDFSVDFDNLVIVPGNHDLNWAFSEKAYDRVNEKKKGLRKIVRSLFDANNKVISPINDDHYKDRFKFFSDFYRDIKGKPYPLEYEQQGIIHHLEKLNLLILGLNSAWQVDHHFTARADINSEALTEALNTINREPQYTNCRKFAVWHHPLTSRSEDRITDYGIMERLALNGFSVCFHGHLHKANSNLFRYDHPANGRKLEIVGAGTFGAPVKDWEPGHPLQYNLIEYTDKQLVVNTRCRTEINGAWKPHAIWTQGPGENPLAYYDIELPARDSSIKNGEPGETSDIRISPSDRVPSADENSKLNEKPAIPNNEELTHDTTKISEAPISPNFQTIKQPGTSTRPTPTTSNQKSAPAPTIAANLTKTIRENITTILNDQRLEPLVEEISRVFRQKKEINITTPVDVAKAIVSQDVVDIQHLLLEARKATIAVMESAGKTRNEINWMRKRVLKVVCWQILLAVNREWISQNGNSLTPTKFSGAVWLPVEKDSSVEVFHAAICGHCATFEIIENH